MQALNRFSYKEVYMWQWLALLSVILLFRLDATPIYILDEAKNAECAREMLQNNDWITPVFNGMLRTDKPPLHYFFMMAAYKMFGYNAFAARFFSSIMGILTVVVTYFYIKKLINAFTAFCSTLVLVCSSHFLFEFRLAVPDPYLIFFITIGLFSGFAWLQQNSFKQLIISAAALAFATLAKGPIAIALPGLCLLIWVIMKRKWQIFFTWKLIPAILLYLLISTPWYYAIYKATNGEWIKSFFLDHNLNRFADPQEGHGGLFIVTLLFALLGLLPFMSFLGELIKKRIHIFSNEVVQFCAIVVLAFVVFFSVASTKLPNYAMPCYPFAAVVLGFFIASLLNGEITSKKYPFYIVLAVTLLLPVAGYFAIRQEAEAKDISWVALLLLIAPLMFIIYVAIARQDNWASRIGFIAFAFSTFNLIGLHYVYPALYNRNPVNKTIDKVRQYHHIYGYKIFNPAYRFYLDKNIPVTDDVQELNHWLDSTPNALVITRTEYMESLKQIQLQEIAKHHDIFELPVTIILEHHAKP